jgi:hypothetical protein
LKRTVWELRTFRTRYGAAIMNATCSEIMQGLEEFTARRQMGFLETVRKISSDKASLIRWGDGELRTMLRLEFEAPLQANSEYLSQQLREAAGVSASDELIVGFPHIFHDSYWQYVWSDIGLETMRMFSHNDILGKAHITRPIYFKTTGHEGVKAWRDVWQDRSVTIITGTDSWFNLTPELFDGVKSVDFIRSSSKNAFSDLERILTEVKAKPSDIFLVALGIAGTVLTHKLFSVGVRAIDIGNISDSYEHVYKNAPYPESKLK